MQNETIDGAAKIQEVTKKDVEKMALSTIGGKFKGVISKDQDLLDAAKHGNVEAIGKLTAKKRQSTASQFLPR